MEGKTFLKKMKIFIDYPVGDGDEFKGLSYPQVLYTFIKQQQNYKIVGENEAFDVIFIINGGSHYISKTVRLKNFINKIFFYNPYIIKFLGFDRLKKSNIEYEKHIERLLKKNPNAKVIHRLDDRYSILTKVYGYDKTIENLNKYADLTITQTKYCQSIWEKDILTIFGKQKAIKLNNPIQINNFVDRTIFNENGEKSSKFKGKINILHVATTGMPRKGLSTVLEFAKLLEDNNDIQFYLVGKQLDDPISGDKVKYFKNITYLGHTSSRYQLAKYYRSADVLLFPSVNDCSPNVVLEAMSCGLAVVGANSGGTPEMIIKDDLKAGQLIIEQNPIFALKEVLDNLDIFKSNALNIIKEYYDVKVVGNELIDKIGKL